MRKIILIGTLFLVLATLILSGCAKTGEATGLPDLKQIQAPQAPALVRANSCDKDAVCETKIVNATSAKIGRIKIGAIDNNTYSIGVDNSDIIGNGSEIIRNASNRKNDIHIKNRIVTNTIIIDALKWNPSGENRYLERDSLCITYSGVVFRCSQQPPSAYY